MSTEVIQIEIDIVFMLISNSKVASSYIILIAERSRALSLPQCCPEIKLDNNNKKIMFFN